MAVYLNNRRSVPDVPSDLRHSEVNDYFVDTPADIALLPDATKIKESSTALILSTGQVYALGGGGWVAI